MKIITKTRSSNIFKLIIFNYITKINSFIINFFTNIITNNYSTNIISRQIKYNNNKISNTFLYISI